MSDKLSDALESLVDDFVGDEGNWSQVVHDAGEVEPPLRRESRFGRLRSTLPRRSRRRVGVRIALAAGVAAAAALAGFSVLPGGNGCGSVFECASAAIAGDGDVVHMVVRVPGPFATPENIHDSQTETWHDTKTGEHYSIFTGRSLTGVSESWVTASGDHYGRYQGVLRKTGSLEKDGPSVTDPVFEFFGTYEDQLRNGTATLAGTMTFDGREAYMIDFPFVDDVGPTGRVTRAAIRVLVDRESYEPVGFGHSVIGGRWIPFIPRVRRVDGKVVVDDSLKVNVVGQVVSAEFTHRTPGMFVVPTK